MKERALRRCLLAAAMAHCSYWMLRPSSQALHGRQQSAFSAPDSAHALPAPLPRQPRTAGSRWPWGAPAPLTALVARPAALAGPATALDTLAESALSRETPPEDVFEAIRVLEKARGAVDEAQLTGDWRLIYTTGTKTTEDQIGRVNYVPITAVQRFDMSKKYIRNGIYLGPLTLEFEGSLRWMDERRRLEFDFEDLKICGISLPLPDSLRGVMGMKSSQPYKKQPAFNFVAVDGKVAAARGAGGGVALWMRNELVAN